MKRENFYRRNPNDALAGMVGMSLEERGVYNTVIDLLYSTWRPVEDSRQFIAGWCGCAVQKLNPILDRLIARGKLIRFEESGSFYISNQRFEDERAEVRGQGKSRSGRGKVGEKSDDVGGKSVGVEQNTEVVGGKGEGNQSDAPLDKNREDKKKNTPHTPNGGGLFEEGEGGQAVPVDEVKAAFDAWNAVAKRHGLPMAEDLTETRKTAIKARLKGGGLPRWTRALDAVQVSGFCLGQHQPRNGDSKPFRATLDFVCQASSFQKLIEGNYGQDAKPAAGAPTMSLVPKFNGPPALRQSVVENTSEAFALNYIDPATWRAEDRTLIAANGFAAKQIERNLRDWLVTSKVRVEIAAQAEGAAA